MIRCFKEIFKTLATWPAYFKLVSSLILIPVGPMTGILLFAFLREVGDPFLQQRLILNMVLYVVTIITLANPDIPLVLLLWLVVNKCHILGHWIVFWWSLSEPNNLDEYRIIYAGWTLAICTLVLFPVALRLVTNWLIPLAARRKMSPNETELLETTYYPSP